MAKDDKTENDDKPKRKVNRQKGGFALVELQEGEDGTGRMLELITSDLDGQKECMDELTAKVESGDIKADGTRTFGIIQVKKLDLCPKSEIKVSF